MSKLETDSIDDSQSNIAQLQARADYLREQVVDVNEADMVVQPNGILNHPAWVTGHLTHACQMLGGVVGIQKWLERYHLLQQRGQSVSAKPREELATRDTPALAGWSVSFSLAQSRVSNERYHLL